MTAREDRTQPCAGAVASCYHGQRSALVTMHGKEVVIARVFRDGLGLFVDTIRDIDTDALGTFRARCRVSARCGQVDVETGLRCEWCGGPSLMVRYQIFGCVACDHLDRRARSDGLSHADPGQCPECNP